jgi:hypothetical protein
MISMIYIGSFFGTINLQFISGSAANWTHRTQHIPPVLTFQTPYENTFLTNAHGFTKKKHCSLEGMQAVCLSVLLVRVNT